MVVFSPGNWIVLLQFHVVSPLKGNPEHGVAFRMMRNDEAQRLGVVYPQEGQGIYFVKSKAPHTCRMHRVHAACRNVFLRLRLLFISRLLSELQRIQHKSRIFCPPKWIPGESICLPGWTGNPCWGLGGTPLIEGNANGQ